MSNDGSVLHSLRSVPPPELPWRLAAAPFGRPPPPPLLVRPFSVGGQSRATMALKVDGRSSRHHDCHALERNVRVRSDLRRCIAWVMPALLVADIGRELHDRTLREQEGTGAMSLTA
jgi:hypothetical protein